LRYAAIRQHLKPYSIVARRSTTVNHAFAAAVAPCDAYEEQVVRAAVAKLGQDPDSDLVCVYCGLPAETWDHINATVRNKLFSGFGHRLGNLLPCCKPCNSRKGNKAWLAHMNSVVLDPAERSRREALIGAYIEQHSTADPPPADSPEYQELLRLQRHVLDLFAQADELAKRIRAKSKTA
jgi:hypothetical protein